MTNRRAFLGAILGLVASHSFAGTHGDSSSELVALCVGNSNYGPGMELPSATRDARLVSIALSNIGFRTTLLTNVSHDEFLLGLAGLRLRARDAAVAAVYVASHGVMANGQTHFLTIGRSPRDFTRHTWISESVLLKAISDKPRHKLLFVDACREVPRASKGGFEEGRAALTYPAGVHVNYASQPGAVAFDGDTGNSPFALALAEAVARPGLTLTDISRLVRLSVLQQTGGRQIPWERSSLLTPIILNTGRNLGAAAALDQ